MNLQGLRQSMGFKCVSFVQGMAFILSSLALPVKVYAQNVLELPAPGVMVSVSDAYVPVMLRAVKIHPDQPLVFDFIVDSGNTKADKAMIKSETEKLVKYFLASLTIAEKDMWVNLSPYEHDRIVPEAFGQTQMGRDLLAQDYILKQLSASLIYPEKDLGKEFWARVYAKARETLGITEIPMNTFNKVWIMPDQAQVYEMNDTAIVGTSHLKVLMEEDYLALSKNSNDDRLGTDKLNQGDVDASSKLSSQVMRELILPEIEKEVNTGKNFAQLRQVYQALILATWYKNNLKESLLSQVYADQNKVAGVDVADKAEKEQIYQRYVAAYKEGVFNYIKEEKDPASDDILPRRYFSGGANFVDMAEKVKVEKVAATGDIPSSVGTGTGDCSQVTVAMDRAKISSQNDRSMLAQEVKKIVEELGWGSEVMINFGDLAKGRNIHVENKNETIVLTNEDNGKQLVISRNVDVTEGAKIGKEVKQDKVQTIKIGSYPYRIIDHQPINLRNQWLGNDALLDFFGVSLEQMSESVDWEEVTVGLTEQQYRYSLIRDVPSRVTGHTLVSERPSLDAVTHATEYLNKNTYKKENALVDKLKYFHYLTILSRTSAVGGGDYKTIMADRILATLKLREAAFEEPTGSVYSKLIEEVMWSSSVWVVRANPMEANLELDAQIVEKIDKKIPFIIEKAEDFNSLSGVFEAMLKSGKMKPYISINIKNFTPDTYLAYLAAVEEISRKYNGNITFIISPEVPGTLAHDMPGAVTALRGMSDVFGKDFFMNEQLALITDGGSKTRGGAVTLVNHNQFSLASLASKVKGRDGQVTVDVTNFLNMNILTTGVAWLQMQEYGKNVFLWPASDGIIKFGGHPRFGNKPLADLPERFMAASGGGVDVLSQDTVDQMNVFLKQHPSVTMENLVLGQNVDSVILNDFQQLFGSQSDPKSVLGKAYDVYNRTDLKLGDKGNFVADGDGKLVTFLEKPKFHQLVATLVMSKTGVDTMNIFFLMADRKTVWDLFVKKFFEVQTETNEYLGQKTVSVFDKVFGGLLKLKTDDTITETAREYVNSNGVALLGVNYGDDYMIGDIGNLDLNAKMLQDLIKDPEIPYGARLNMDNVIIPSNVQIYYKGKRLGPDQKDALFLLKNVRVIVDDGDTKTHEIYLGEGSGIINSIIHFSSQGLDKLSLKEGSVIIDSEIAGKIVIHGKRAIIEGVAHVPSAFPTYDYDVDRRTGEVTKNLVPTDLLEFYGDETTVSLFMQKEGKVRNVVARNWSPYDLKKPIARVSLDYNPDMLLDIELVGKVSSSDTQFKTTQMARNAALKRMMARHPRMLGFLTANDIFVENPMPDKPKTKVLNDLPIYDGAFDFEGAKSQINAVKQRQQLERVRSAYDRTRELKPGPNLKGDVDHAEYGGIDFNPAGLNLKVERTDQGIKVQVDPAEIQRIKTEGVTGFRPVIINITPVKGIISALGLAPQEGVSAVSG